MKRGTGPLLIVREVEDRLADKGKGQQREEIPLPVPCVREALGEQEDIERKSEVAQHIKHAVDALHGAEPCGRVLRDERASVLTAERREKAAPDHEHIRMVAEHGDHGDVFEREAAQLFGDLFHEGFSCVRTAPRAERKSSHASGWST